MKPLHFALLACSLCLILGAITPHARSQSPSEPVSGEETPDEVKERVTAERFLQLLKRRPRLGTALDKVYGYHVARGSLESFCQSLEAEAIAKNDGALWLIYGMVQMQRGLDTEAAISFEKAQELLPEEPLASYYLGKSLVLVGEIDKASDAMRTAIERKPARADMLAIFQDLGRIYQRTGRSDDAMDVWAELENQFPDDAQVKAEIARILAEEGALVAAVERYDALAISTKDGFRKVEMAIRAAQLKAQLGKSEEALRAFETQLTKVNPNSWLYRDIRRRIEEVFWSSGDVDGLVAYYTKWVDAHPEDVDAMMRTARFLSIQRRLPEAEKWFRKAIGKAPSSPEPRTALIESFVSDGQYGKAAEEMAELIELTPDDPDNLVRWGELVFNDADRAEDQRKTEAAAIWKRLLDKRANDPVTLARVADLLRGVEATDEALTHYRKAIELAPGESQYREYLGEYLHQLGRKEEAVKVWRDLASGDRATRDNLVRLSEVLGTFGYATEALEFIAQACKKDPTFGHRARYAELLREAGKHDESLAQLDLAEPLAEDPELREIVLIERIKNYQESGSLTDCIDDAEAAVAGDKANDPDAWRMLALLREADRQFQPACEAAEKAASLASGDPAMWETAATLQERSGRFGDAVQSFRKLATIDRRFLSSYLTQIASLEMRVGNTDAALKAGEELIESAPGNSEHYRFFADLCFQVGDEDRGLEVLRRSVRSNPNDSDALLYLARQLSDAFHTDEAIELYWRGFDLAKDLDGKVAVIQPLTELYLRTNRFEVLTDRLEATGREANKPRDGLLWVASAHQAAGDLGMAKQLLEQLAREDSRDTKLLGQLVTLSRAESDFESAAEYQKRLVAIAPTLEAEYLLASILLDLGEVDQSEAMWLKLAQRKGDPGALSDAIGALVQKEQFETAAELVDKALARDATDWEMLAQSMLVNVRLKRHEAAQTVANRVLAMNIEPSEPTKKVRQEIERRSSQRSNTPAGYDPYQHLGSPVMLLQTANQVKAFLSPGSDDPFAYAYGGQSGFTPRCFQDVQAIAYCIPLATAAKDFNQEDFINDKVADALQSKSRDDLWKAIFYLTWRNPSVMHGQARDEQYEKCISALVELEDPYAAGQSLSSLMNQRQRLTNNSNDAPPLDDKELQRIKHLSELTAKVGKDAASYLNLWVASEYTRAGKEEEAAALIEQYVEKAKRSTNNGMAMLQSMSVFLNDRFNSEPTADSMQKAREFFKAYLQQSKSSSVANSGGGGLLHSLAEKVVQHESLENGLKCVDDVLQWQAAQTAALRPSQRERATAGGPLTFHRQVKGNHEQVVIAFPQPSSYFGPDCIYLLRGLYDACKDDPEKLAEVHSQLAAWSAADSDDPYLKFARLMAEASVAYWDEDLDGVKQIFAKASEAQVGGQLVDLALTRMLYESGQAEEALAVVERLRPSNQQMLVDKELAILQLVLQLGDLERAKVSAQKLFVLRLPSDTEFKLADLMYQLGMQDLGDRMMGRIRRRAGGKQDMLAQLMQRYVSAGKNTEAAEIARQVVRRTEPRGLSPYQRSENVQHEQAVRVLAQTKQLEPLIKQYEELVKRSPNSQKLVDNLAAFYEASGRRTDAQKLRVKAAEDSPDDPRSLYAAGQQLQNTGKHAEAVKKYVAAIRKSPELMNQSFYQMRDSFNKTKSWAELSDGIIDEGIEKFTRSYQLGQVMSQLVEANDHAAINRFLHAGLTKLPLAQFSQIARFDARKDLHIEKRVSDLLGDKLTANDAQLEALTQNGFANSHSPGGNVSGFVNGVAFIVSQDDDLRQRVVESMNERLEKDDVLFARVLVALTMVYAKDFDELKKVVKPLVEKEKKGLADAQALWCLASALTYEADQPALACELIESIDDRSVLQQRSMMEFEYTADALLAAAYQKAGRNADARLILVDRLANMKIDEQQNQHNPGYGEYQYIESMASLAETFIEMNYPAEAFIAYRKGYGDKELLERSSRWGGDSDWRSKQITEAIAKKTSAKTVLPLIAYAVNGQSGDNADANLAETATYLTSPEISSRSLIDVRVTMPLEEFALQVPEDKEVRTAIRKWLDDHPLDEEAEQQELKPLVMRLLVAHAANHDDAARQAAEAITEWVMSHDAPAPENASAQDDASKGIKAKSKKAAEAPLPEDLLLAMAASRFPEDVADKMTIGLMLERAATAAERCGQEGLADGLQCQLAQQIADDDPDRARQILQKALDRILPLEKEPASKKPAGS